MSERTVECVHCSGTGSCEHSVKKRGHDTVKGIIFNKEVNHRKWRECSRCGRGQEVPDTLFSSPNAPVCGVCGGKGFHELSPPGYYQR